MLCLYLSPFIETYFGRHPERRSNRRVSTWQSTFQVTGHTCIAICKQFCIANTPALQNECDLLTVTYIINFQKCAKYTSFLTFLLHWLTVSRVRAANILRHPCSDSSHCTAPYKCHFIIIMYCYYYRAWSMHLSAWKWCKLLTVTEKIPILLF